MKTIRFLPEDPRQKLFWRKAIDVEVAPFAAPSPSGYRTLLVEGLLSLFFFALLYAIFWLWFLIAFPSPQKE
ncbi:hypothetical protein QR680_017186 [Steinernema hermaphroditum]|uniref:Uncharacterized protein n=1 Tax=Steinernema hermaphroditum TaxID=289476 RepID=A0AA39LNP0_9BILA|nr:hypothetical protein QR680_017186 [Steinernema hermaphroditum]